MSKPENFLIPLVWKLAVKEVFGLDTEIEEVRFFLSKKNQVSKIRLFNSSGSREVIAKKYVWGNMAAELAVLSKALDLGIEVPRPIATLKDVVFLEAIEGKQLPRPVTSTTIKTLGHWLNSFHKFMTPAKAKGTFLRGDSHLSNFLLKDDKIIGLDFEEAYFGHLEDDLGSLLASILMSLGAEYLSQFRELVYSFCEGYNLENYDRELLFEVVGDNLQSKKKYNPQFTEKICLLENFWQKMGKQFLP